jgi:putative peptide zinc metalloprotease protein
LNKIFEPYGLKVLGQIIALGAAYGLFIQPLWKMYKFFSVPGRLGKVKRWRMYATLVLIASVIAAVFFIPLPSHVFCPLEVQARDAASVYVQVDGVLDKVLVKPGDRVTEGQLLAQLRNIDVDITIAELMGQREVYTAELEGLRKISLEDRRASTHVDPVIESLADVNHRLAKQEEDREKLRLVAPRAGTVLPAPLVENRVDEELHLPTWSGSPLDKENLGAALRAGTKLCQVGEPNRFEARLVIDQGDVEFVAPGQRVEIMLDQSAEVVYVSQIEDRGSKTIKETPPHLSSLHGGPLPTQMGPDGVARPLSAVFDALVPLPEQDPHGLLRIGLVGRAKITTAPRTLAARVWRYFSRTFNFEL